MAQHNNHSSQHGFTLVEMMVIAPIMILIIGAIIVAIVTLTGDSLAEGARAQLISDVQGGLDSIEDDVRTSGAYLSTNNFTPVSPQGADDGTQKFVSISVAGQDTLILNTFATTTNPANLNRTLVYLPNTPYACNDANVAQNQVMTMNVVYFVKDSTLWRRTMAVSSYANNAKSCAGVVWQQPNCAEVKMSSNTALCKSVDEKVLSGVNSADFSILYLSNPAATTGGLGTEEANPDVRQSSIDQATTIQVSLKASRTVAGRDLVQQGVVRVTRAGSLVKYATPDP